MLPSLAHTDKYTTLIAVNHMQRVYTQKISNVRNFVLFIENIFFIIVCAGE